jgi:hypothetical protein
MMSADARELAGLQELLVRVAGQISPRKLDLFNSWCCQILRPYLTDRRSIAAARYAERNIDDGWPDDEERFQVLAAARAAVHDLMAWVKTAPTSLERRKRRVYAHAALVAQQTVDITSENRGVVPNSKFTAYVFGWANDDGPSAPRDGAPDSEGLREVHLRTQAAVLHDILGNCLHLGSFDPRWRTSDVLGVARGIYDEKAFVRMPILADALMDAGCEDEAIISHCRGHGLHVRGCWAVDMVLQKG